MSAKETKELILSKSKELFAEKGYHGVTTKIIAVACGIPTGSIHYHFQTKENLYRHILREYGRKNLILSEEILKKPTSLDDFKTRFSLYTEVMLTKYMEESSTFKIVMREAEVVDTTFMNEFSEVYNHFNMLLFGFFEGAQKKKYFKKKVDVGFLVQSYWALTAHQIKLDQVLGKLTGQTLTDPAFKKKWVQEFQEIFFCRLGIE